MTKMSARPGCVDKDANGNYLTEIGLMHVLELSTLGSDVTEIADYLRVSRPWLMNRLDPDHKQFDENIFAARSEGTGEFRRRLRTAQANLSDTNAQMAIWLGKQSLGQKDKHEVEITKTVHIVGTLPNYAQTPEAWRAQFGPQGAKAALASATVEEAEIIDLEAEDAPE